MAGAGVPRCRRPGGVHRGRPGRRSRSLVGAVDKGAIDFDTAVRLTRAVGQTMARLADWQVATLSARVEELEAGEEATGSRIGSALRLTEQVGLPFEKLLIYSWRRHLAAAVAGSRRSAPTPRTCTPPGSPSASPTWSASRRCRTGSTRTGSATWWRSSSPGAPTWWPPGAGRVIKTLGDSVLFVSDDPVAAMDIALAIVDVIGHDNRLPDVRIGLATGSVVLQLGDVYGPPVNMAARLTALARRNRVITDAATADLLPDDLFDSRLLPARPVRGFGLVEPVAVRRH